MRLFVAIELEEHARNDIVAVQKRLAPMVAGRDAALKWARPDQMHLTLAFIGSVNPEHAARIVAAGGPPIPVAPFHISFTGVGVFPPRGAPRVLWLGVGQGAQDVIRVQQIVAERLAAAAVELEARPFRPHVTLARWKSSRGADGRRVRDAEIEARIVPTTVDAVTLFESRQSVAGSVYTALARTPLEGSD